MSESDAALQDQRDWPSQGFAQRLGSRIERHVMRSAVDMLDERGTELDTIERDLQRREADVTERLAQTEAQEAELEHRERRLGELGAGDIQGQPRIDHLDSPARPGGSRAGPGPAESRQELAAAHEQGARIAGEDQASGGGRAPPPAHAGRHHPARISVLVEESASSGNRMKSSVGAPTRSRRASKGSCARPSPRRARASRRRIRGRPPHSARLAGEAASGRSRSARRSSRSPIRLVECRPCLESLRRTRSRRRVELRTAEASGTPCRPRGPQARAAG